MPILIRGLFGTQFAQDGDLFYPQYAQNTVCSIDWMNFRWERTSNFILSIEMSCVLRILTVIKDKVPRIVRTRWTASKVEYEYSKWQHPAHTQNKTGHFPMHTEYKMNVALCIHSMV